MTNPARPGQRPAGPASVIRPARPADIPVISRLVRDLAEYEKLGDCVRATSADLHDSLFAETPAVFAHVAERGGEVVGVAIWFLSYSTFLGRHGIYLEDLYVMPQVRGYGYGRALVAELARICVQRGYGRLEWSVLDWNAPAISFYRSLGGVPVDGWTVYQLTGDALGEAAALSPAAE